MTRRDFTVLSLSGGALAAVSGLASAQQKHSADKHASAIPHDALRSCAKACSDCQRECDACATHCAHLLHKGEHDHLTTLMTCQDCADFCAAAAQVVARGGPFAVLICQGCADACAKCGRECERFPANERMKACAQECRKCEEACREMIKHGAHAG